MMKQNIVDQLRKIDENLYLLQESGILDKGEFYDALKGGRENQLFGPLEQFYFDQCDEIEKLRQSVAQLAGIIENMHYAVSQMATAPTPYYDSSKSHLLPEIKSRHGVY